MVRVTLTETLTIDTFQLSYTLIGFDARHVHDADTWYRHDMLGTVVKFMLPDLWALICFLAIAMNLKIWCFKPIIVKQVIV